MSTPESRAAVLRLFPTLSTNPVMAELLARCETRLQQIADDDQPREVTRVLRTSPGVK